MVYNWFENMCYNENNSNHLWIALKAQVRTMKTSVATVHM